MQYIYLSYIQFDVYLFILYLNYKYNKNINEYIL